MAVKRSLEISNPKDPSAAKTMADATPYEDQSVLVEGPGPGEAEFIGRWLLAAAAADRTLQEQFKRNTAKTMADATPYEDQSVLVEGPGQGKQSSSAAGCWPPPPQIERCRNSSSVIPL
jgi:hypothetical protein